MSELTDDDKAQQATGLEFTNGGMCACGAHPVSGTSGLMINGLVHSQDICKPPAMIAPDLQERVARLERRTEVSFEIHDRVSRLLQELTERVIALEERSKP